MPGGGTRHQPYQSLEANPPALWEVYIFYEWNLVGWRGFEPPSSRPEDERSTDWATTRKKRRNEEALLYVLTQIMSK